MPRNLLEYLAELLDRVSRGEKITITRHGISAAMLVPVEETRTRMTHKEIVEGMRELRKRIKPGKMSVRELVEEGRQWKATEFRQCSSESYRCPREP
jgi:prevent-host-death family protein